MTQEVELESFQPSVSSRIFMKFTGLKKRFRRLEAERDVISLRALELGYENEELRRDVEEKSRLERFYNTAGAIADREVLRERLRVKEERMAGLAGLLEAQEASIVDLTSQLHWLTSTMSAKEEFISKEIEELKSELDEKASHISNLEEKVHRSELLIQELEKLKLNYRLAWASLNENMLVYKTQFKAVVGCSERLLSDKELRDKELAAKEELIKKLSIFPQSPKLLVHLSQIAHLLKTTEASLMDDSDHVMSYVPSIRRIVEAMKSQLWEDPDVNITDMENIKTQTEVNQKECYTEIEFFSFSSHEFVQVEIPGKYYFECRKLQDELNNINYQMMSLEQAYYKKDEVNKELEKKLIGLITEKTSIEKMLIKKQKEVELEEEKLLILKGELEYNDCLLKKALSEIEKQQEVSELNWELTKLTLDSSIEDCNEYTKVIDSFVKDSEEKVEVMENRWNEEVQRIYRVDEEYYSKVRHELKQLYEKYKTKESLNEEQICEINKLRSALNGKYYTFKTIVELLLKAECRFDNMVKLDVSINHSEQTSPEPEFLAVEACNRILQYSEYIENQWRIQLNINDKLEKEAYSHSYVATLMKTNRIKSKHLKKTVKDLNKSCNKVKLALLKTRSKMKHVNKQLNNSVKSFVEMKVFNSELEEKNNFVTGKLDSTTNEIKRLEVVLQERDSNYNVLSYEKEKMEKVLLKIIKDLEQSMADQVINKESVGISTESGSTFEEIDILDLADKNKALSNAISELQNKFDCLMNIPEKDCSSDTFSVCLQTDMDFCNDKIRAMELKYNKTIAKLREDLSKERLNSNSKISSIEKLKQSNEKDNKRLSLEHKRAISQLRDSFAKEKSELSSKYSKERKQLLEKLENFEKQKNESEGLIGKLSIEKNEQIKNYESIIMMKEKMLIEKETYYENLLAQKDDEMNREIMELKIEINNIIEKKEEIITKTKEMSLIHVNQLKKKFKTINKKLRRQKCSMEDQVIKLKGMLSKGEVSSECCQTDGVGDCRCASELSLEDTTSQTELACYTRDLSLQDAASQTVFFYTHFRTCDATSQAAAPVKTSVSQTEAGFTATSEGETHQPVNGKEDHVVFGLPVTRKDISINFKEQIKCSIQETKGGIVSAFFNQISPLSDVRDVSFLRDKNELISHVSYLENELMKKTEDFNRNVEMYQDTIRRQRRKVEELEKLLSEEVQDTYSLRDRLGREYQRAERLGAEKRDLQNYVGTLQKNLRDHENECQAEREKYKYWQNHFENTRNQRKTSDELEESLKRLQEKVDKAVSYEKKIMEDCKEDSKAKDRRASILYVDRFQRPEPIISAKEETEYLDINLTGTSVEDDESGDYRKLMDVTADTPKSDLKVVYFQKCEVRHAWSTAETQNDNYLGT